MHLNYLNTSTFLLFESAVVLQEICGAYCPQNVYLMFKAVRSHLCYQPLVRKDQSLFDLDK